MNRIARYVTALLVASLITGFTSLIDPSTRILFGIFGIYAVTAEIVVRYPQLVWSHNTPSLPAGVFGGGATFGGAMLADAYGPEYQFGAAMLGLGIAIFGLSTGYWLADSTEPPAS